MKTCFFYLRDAHNLQNISPLVPNRDKKYCPMKPDEDILIKTLSLKGHVWNRRNLKLSTEVFTIPIVDNFGHRIAN